MNLDSKGAFFGSSSALGKSEGAAERHEKQASK